MKHFAKRSLRELAPFMSVETTLPGNINRTIFKRINNKSVNEMYFRRYTYQVYPPTGYQSPERQTNQWLYCNNDSRDQKQIIILDLFYL